MFLRCITCLKNRSSKECINSTIVDKSYHFYILSNTLFPSVSWIIWKDYTVWIIFQFKALHHIVLKWSCSQFIFSSQFANYDKCSVFLFYLQQITIAEIRKDEWFLKYYTPVQAIDYKHVNLDYVYAAVDDSEVGFSPHNSLSPICLLVSIVYIIKHVFNGLCDILHFRNKRMHMMEHETWVHCL